MMDNIITFDTANNELKILEFIVGEEHFGINIAKVSEIVLMPQLTPMPSTPDAVEGVFMHRDKLVTVIDLHTVLSYPLKETDGDGLLIVCDFEQLSVAFHVSNVNGMQTVSWSSVEKPPAISASGSEHIATGIAKLDNRMIMILDFEKIICDFNVGADFNVGDLEEIETVDKFDYSRHIVVAEDSQFLNRIVVDALRKTGFKNIDTFYNGLDAWDYINNQKGTDKLKHNAAALITDIEMPQMDGHSLTRLIRKDKELRHMPVFLFSSLIHENMRARGNSAGATGQYARSQLNNMLHDLIDSL